MFLVGTSLYVTGGVVHAVKVQGRDLREGLSLLPHQAFWKELRGLVEDGVGLTKSSAFFTLKQEQTCHVDLVAKVTMPTLLLAAYYRLP